MSASSRELQGCPLLTKRKNIHSGAGVGTIIHQGHLLSAAFCSARYLQWQQATPGMQMSRCFGRSPLLQLQALPRSPPHLVHLLQHAPLACAALSVTHLSGAVVVPHLQAACTQVCIGSHRAQSTPVHHRTPVPVPQTCNCQQDTYTRAGPCPVTACEQALRPQQSKSPV